LINLYIRVNINYQGYKGSHTSRGDSKKRRRRRRRRRIVSVAATRRGQRAIAQHQRAGGGGGGNPKRVLSSLKTVTGGVNWPVTTFEGVAC
jgi:hypothetical protein